MMQSVLKNVTVLNMVREVMLKIAGIVEDSIVDGPGLRTVIFGQGCPHRCPGCHNPDTWEADGGTAMTEEQVFEIITRNPLCGGVTFSGGEPFAQAGGFGRLAKRLREKGYEVASYSGYTFEELCTGTDEQKELLRNVDILIDGTFVLAERSLNLSFRGSKNQRILNVSESLKQKRAVLEHRSRWTGEDIAV